MTKRIKVRIDTGCVTEAYDAPPWEQAQKGRPRFKTEAEREAHREAIRRRDEMRSAAKKTAEGGKKI